MNKRLLILLCLTVLTGCHRTVDNNKVNETPAQAKATETPRQPDPPPTHDEVRAAVQRNYAGDVTIDDTRPIPFMTGDFNGDNSEDIAIFVKPRSDKLSDLNSEFANWILEDPKQVRQLSGKVKPGEVLLVVIHGHEREGWRSDLARQTYLLKNVVGTEFRTQSINQLSASAENRSLPQLRGDVIREKVNDSVGIIYWTGAKYAWHPVS
ncbi:MAG TPA: hypothetical protein VGJ37_15260 [Pyrinomonadaceae bacterium]|jgi:hypothetical protein